MTDEKQAIDAAVEQFRSLMESQLARAKRIREDKDFTDFDALDTIVIGICGGDGIGPVITKESERVLSFLLKDEVASGKIRFKEIDGLTIENRAACNTGPAESLQCNFERPHHHAPRRGSVAQCGVCQCGNA